MASEPGTLHVMVGPPLSDTVRRLAKAAGFRTASAAAVQAVREWVERQEKSLNPPSIAGLSDEALTQLATQIAARLAEQGKRKPRGKGR